MHSRRPRSATRGPVKCAVFTMDGPCVLEKPHHRGSSFPPVCWSHQKSCRHGSSLAKFLWPRPAPVQVTTVATHVRVVAPSFVQESAFTFTSGVPIMLRPLQSKHFVLSLEAPACGNEPLRTWHPVLGRHSSTRDLFLSTSPKTGAVDTHTYTHTNGAAKQAPQKRTNALHQNVGTYVRCANPPSDRQAPKHSPQGESGPR